MAWHSHSAEPKVKIETAKIETIKQSRIEIAERELHV